MRGRRVLCTVAGFCAVTFLVYGMSLGNGFVAWDDTYLIYGNPAIKAISWANLKTIFSTFDPQLYIPLTFLSYQLDFLIGGLWPLPYHTGNLILHTGNALLVTLILFQLTRLRLVAILLGLLFAVHPLNAEAVAWASARKDVLSTFFFLASLSTYLHFRAAGGRIPYFGAIVAFVLGLLAKVMVLTLPGVLLLVEWHDRRRPWRTVPPELLPFFSASILFGIIALFGKRDLLATSTAAEKLLMASRSTAFYLQKFLFPHPLSVLYPHEGAIAIGAPTFLLSVAVLAILAVAVFRTLRRTRDAAFAAAFFALTLAPTFVNFAKEGELYIGSDRYAYVPMLGLLFLLAIPLRRLLAARHTATIAISSAVLAILGILAVRQSLTWRNTETLFVHTLTTAPRAVAAHINIAWYLQETDRPEEAATHLNSAIAVRPHARAYTGLGSLAAKRGDAPAAIAAYERAIALSPRDPEPHFGLALIAAANGDLAGAAREYDNVLFLQPDHISAHNNLAAVLLRQGDRDGAVAHFAVSIALDPTYADAHYNLAVVEEDHGNDAAAISHYEAALALEPQMADALTRLAPLYLRQRRIEEAVALLKRALARDPQNPDARALLQSLVRHGVLRTR